MYILTCMFYFISSDILESYSRSPFLGTDANFMDPHIRGEQQGTFLAFNTVFYLKMVKPADNYWFTHLQTLRGWTLYRRA